MLPEAKRRGLGLLKKIVERKKRKNPKKFPLLRSLQAHMQKERLAGLNPLTIEDFDSSSGQQNSEMQMSRDKDGGAKWSAVLESTRLVRFLEC